MYNLKTLTKANLIDYLTDDYEPRAEPDALGNILYYVHIDDEGNLVDDCYTAETTITARLCGVEDIHTETMEGVWEKETMDAPEFADVVEDLWRQLQNLK